MLDFVCEGRRCPGRATGVTRQYTQGLTSLLFSAILHSEVMDRRTVLQRLAGLLALTKYPALSAGSDIVVFPQEQSETLRSVAALVLPSQIGASGRERVVQRFESYVREYRAGADTEHGYGVTHVRPKPASPARAYVGQLRALPSHVTPESITQHLDRLATKDLPRIPEGKDVVVDLMSFYFRSSEANDLCYEALIGRDECHGLAGSDKIPASLKESA